MIKKITLNEDHIKLIPFIKFEAFEFAKNSRNERIGWGVDQYSLFGGSYCLEQTSRILGLYDQHIKGTEETTLGVAFEKEIEDRLWADYQYLWDNIEYIISLVLYYSTRGGISVGTYKTIVEEGIWEKVD